MCYVFIIALMLNCIPFCVQLSILLYVGISMSSALLLESVCFRFFRLFHTSYLAFNKLIFLLVVCDIALSVAKAPRLLVTHFVNSSASVTRVVNELPSVVSLLFGTSCCLSLEDLV